MGWSSRISEECPTLAWNIEKTKSAVDKIFVINCPLMCLKGLCLTGSTIDSQAKLNPVPLLNETYQILTTIRPQWFWSWETLLYQPQIDSCCRPIRSPCAFLASSGRIMRSRSKSWAKLESGGVIFDLKGFELWGWTAQDAGLIPGFGLSKYRFFDFG